MKLKNIYNFYKLNNKSVDNPYILHSKKTA